MSPHVTLAELLAELDRGGIIEAPIAAKGWHISGVLDRETQLIAINPAPELALAILHELTHRRHPRMSETRVDRESRRLLSSMSDEDVSDLVRRYRRKRHKRRLVKVESVA